MHATCSVHCESHYFMTVIISKRKEISAQVALNINGHKTKYLRCTKKQHQTDGIDIIQTHLEQVKSFKYLGSIVNGNNSIAQEIKGRISLGNRAFQANQDLFKSKLLTKKSKLRMYQTLFRPVVTYACETWVLKENIKTN